MSALTKRAAAVASIGDIRRRLEVRSGAASPAIAASLRMQRGSPSPFHAGDTNHCPTCGARAWHVGRHVAECAGCGLPLPIVENSYRGD